MCGPVSSDHARPRVGGIRLVGPQAQDLAEVLELSLPRPPEDGTEKRVAGSEVVDEHAGGRAGRGGQRLEPIGQPVGERVVGAGVEKSLTDLGLLAPAHREELFT